MTHVQDVAGPAGHNLVCGSRRTSAQCLPVALVAQPLLYGHLQMQAVALGARRIGFPWRRERSNAWSGNESSERRRLAEQPDITRETRVL